MRQRILHTAIAFAAVLAAAACARADLVPTSASAAPATAAPQSGAPASPAQRPAQFIDELLADASPWGEAPLPAHALACRLDDTSPAQPVATIPSGPSSASLFLLALGGLGAWNLGRNARKIHLGSLPEWYHAGGPRQVGYATPLDLDFNLSALPLCHFEPLRARLSASERCWRVWREPSARVISQSTPRAAAPRAPPLHS